MQDKKDNPNITVPEKPINSAVFSLFVGDARLLFLFKKTEKLASAIFLLSKFFDDYEPLKGHLRKIVLAIINKVTPVRVNQSLNSDSIKYELGPLLIELISCIEIADVAGLISRMNCSILKEEIENVVLFLDQQSFADGRTVLSKNFFSVADNVSTVKGSSNARSDIGHYKGDLKSPLGSRAHHKGHLKDSAGGAQHVAINKRHLAMHDSQVSDRSNAIINIVKQKNNLTIKDISVVIKDCSEKTIQRELLRLVQDGVLKREGERRWSRYSLAM